jgi:hypothetical protein
VAEVRPAFYARTGSRAWDWWSLLHPPYTAWHLSYVVIGACLAPRVRLSTLLATLLAFFLAVGVGAHALDEWNGRPLGTRIPSRQLVGAGMAGLAGAIAIGALGVGRTSPWLIAFIAAGGFMVVAYDLELFGGLAHTDLGFAASWGAFPVLTSYFAQALGLGIASILVAVAAGALSVAQRRLSTPARLLRRRVSSAEVQLHLSDGSVERVGAAGLLAPLESALRAMTWGVVLAAAGLAVSRLT